MSLTCTNDDTVLLRHCIKKIDLYITSHTVIELLTQIVRKNKMYVEWKTTPMTSADNEQIKLRFKNYEKKSAERHTGNN